MSSFFCIHIGTIGLILDIIGVSLIFFVIIWAGDQVILADMEEEASRKKMVKGKKILQYLGYGLILIGFVFQLISNEMNISAN